LPLDEFDHAGFAPFQERWMRWDCFAGRRVSLQLPTQTVQGRAHGIDERGALLLEVQGEVRAFTWWRSQAQGGIVILLVDIGNTRLKWALINGADWAQQGATAHQDVPPETLFTSRWTELPAPRRVVVANVAGKKFAAALRA